MQKPSNGKVNDVTEVQEVKLGLGSHTRYITPNIIKPNRAHYPSNRISTTKYTM